MSTDPLDPKVHVAALTQLLADQDGRLNADQLAPIIQAVTQDIEAAADKAIVDGERIAKLESQTRVLADAVVAITETSAALAPAVRAVKDTM